MKTSITERIRNAWHALSHDAPPAIMAPKMTQSARPDAVRTSGGKERSILNSIINRIAVDVSQIELIHAMLDEKGRFVKTIDSNFNSVLNYSANIDQTGRAMILDATITLLDKGVVALVPYDCENDPKTKGFDIYRMRASEILEWAPNDIRVRIYDERSGTHKEMWFPKSITSIVYNPFSVIMNERNSTMQRLVHKLALLDRIDEQIGSNKLNIIVQLPYAVKTANKQQQASDHLKDIREQMTNNEYGIGYIDATEKVIQLNRPLENSMAQQVDTLTATLYSQLGMTPGILDGTANEQTMQNYYTRVVEPIAAAFVDEFNRKYLLESVRESREAIVFFRDPFKMIPVTEISKIADTFTRNEIMTRNEIRAKIGLMPSDDEKAEMLINSNINATGGSVTDQPTAAQENPTGENQNG